MNLIYPQFGRAFACIAFLSLLFTTTHGQKLGDGDTYSIKAIQNSAEIVSSPNAAVPVINFGNSNSSCADLNALHVGGVGDIRFSHIITDWELRLDIFDANGTYPFTNGPGRTVVGPENAVRSVTIASGSTPGANISSWRSTLPITAIIMRVGLTTYVFPYKPFRLLDTDLLTNDANFYAFTSFCFSDPINPTAGEAAINGRVVDANGRGISKAQIVLVNGVTGEAKITMTSPFGYYRIEGLEVGELYVLNVSHKRYNFAERQRTIPLLDDLAAADFVADP